MKRTIMIKKTLSLLLVFVFFFLLIPIPVHAAETDICAHTYEETLVEATCEEEGYTLFTCSLCGDTYQDNYTDALDHDFVLTEIVEPNCTYDGYSVYTCSRCGTSQQADATPSNGKHIHVITEQVNATCFVDGYTTYTCSACGHSYTETILATHNYEVTYYDPTCLDPGILVYACPDCGDTFALIDDEFPAVGHNYVTTVSDPTCADYGFTMHSCSSCGDTYYTDYVDMTDHTYSASVTAPTCSAAGYTTHTCTCCGHSYTDEKVNALGHTYTIKVVSGSAIYTCKTCGYSYTKASEKTTYSRVTKFTAGESYVIAVYNGRTAYALSHVANKISAVKITISGGKITSTVSEDMLWNYSAGRLSYVDDGKTYYLHAPNTTSGTGYTTLSASTISASNLSYSPNKLLVGTRFLCYNGGTIKGYRTAGITYLMEKN